ncbi:MAG: hypothetical protein HUU02_05765 [Bacteroidetes bacterium]|nr:hypothetical protein [Bacteroidota bacterium]
MITLPRNHIFIILIMVIFFSNNANSQIGTAIPSSRIVDWRFVGVRSFPMIYDKYIDVSQDPAYPVTNNMVDAYPNLKLQLDNRDRSKMTIFYFPPGTYHFSQQIVLDSNITIRGAGSTNTYFSFSTSQYAIIVSAGTINEITGYIDSGKEKGSKSVTFNLGNYSLIG